MIECGVLYLKTKGIFKYAGESTDYGGSKSYVYESENWTINVWIGSLSRNFKDISIEGSVENLRGDIFHFWLFNSLYIEYARELVSDYNGLGTKYDENDKIIPRYVINKIKDIEINRKNGIVDWNK